MDDEIDLRKYWLVLKRQWKPALGTFGLVMLSSLVLALSRAAVYEAESKLLIKSDRSTSLTGLGESLGRIEALTFQANPLDTQVEIIESDAVLGSVIQELSLLGDDGTPLKAKDLLTNLTVEAVRGADIISIAYKSDDPEMAASVANKVADTFIHNDMQGNRAEATAARDFISAQLPKTEADLNRAEQNLRQFKENNQIVALEQEARLLVDTSFALQRQIESSESQISSISSTIEAYQRQLNIRDTEFAIVLAALSQAGGVQQVLQELQNVEEEIATMSTQFTSNSQVITRLNASRQNLRSVLQERTNQVINNRPFPENVNLQIGDLQANLIGEVVSLDAQRQGLIDQIATLSEQIETYRLRMRILPQLESKEAELVRELEVAKTTYETLLSRFQQLQVAESQNIGTARIISPALIPEESTDTQNKLIVAAGFLAGILLGITVAFIIDLFDGTLKTVKEIKEFLGYKILGIIPAIDPLCEAKLYETKERWIPSVIMKDLPHSSISEAYRILRANLDSLGTNHIKTIAVTSSSPKEGKSEVAANLSAAMAQAGKKVLLIDADLQTPIQHRVWDVPNLEGLSNALNSQLDARGMVKTVMQNLSVLPSGVVDRNSVPLINLKNMSSLIAEFSDSYDIIVFDTSPLLNTANSITLSKLVDGVLLVVRPGSAVTPKTQVAKEFLSTRAVLGMVINGVNIKLEPDSYFDPNITNIFQENLSCHQDIIRKRSTI